MAEVSIDAGDLVVDLTGFEKAEAFHGDLRIPVTSITGAEVIEDARHGVGGIKVIGTGMRGVVEVGTFRKQGRTTFAVVHHDTPRGVAVHLQGADYDELIIGSPDPERLIAIIRPHLGE